jgi:MoaA/NifB/PqqE/SkfB family radical SAM enzyme
MHKKQITGMLNGQSLAETYRRYMTMETGRISSLPIVILMPHSACNCRCTMCDIWKANNHLKQLKEEDIQGLLSTFKKFHTREVVMSGGEAILNPNFFRFCEIIRKEKIKLTLLSTGLTIGKHVQSILQWVNEIIVSLDGDEAVHNRIRNIPEAFSKLKSGIEAIRQADSNYRITGRSVIQKMNFRNWASIIDSAKQLGLNQISFLPADLSSEAFNRKDPWNSQRQEEIMLNEKELQEMKLVINQICTKYKNEFESGFIAESPAKIEKILTYYSAWQGLNPFPYKKCNAPWVSTVVEADGTVRPCFFHAAIGNIRTDSLDNILNGKYGQAFRDSLDVQENKICERCVCSLYLPPFRNPMAANATLSNKVEKNEFYKDH